jgi:tryptophan halogenase
MQDTAQDRRIRDIVIVGGGTAGWMAAASLRHHFGSAPVTITLIESSEIGTIGVGEATIPTIRRFYQALGLSDIDVLRATGGTCKLGIRFNDWLKPGSSFVHPFGLFGQDLKNVGFHHYWMRLRAAGETVPLGDYSLGASLASGGKFTTPSLNPPSSLSVFDWALHFDASLFAKLMRQVAERGGVRRIDARITKVNLRPEDGFIESVDLDTGTSVSGDLFIDCSGFRGLLIEEALHTGYEDWSHWLLCDRALAVQSEGKGDPPPYTDVTARPAGWQWRIPLQHRYGNGYVYSSRHTTDDEARAVLTGSLEERLLHEPRKITFNPGRRLKAWNRNCIALGLASGFLEPLESTSIALIETGIEKIKQLFPSRDFDPKVIDEFNEMSRLEFERVRDFIILHYKANRRPNTPGGDPTGFWTHCREMSIPDTLQKKIDLWKAQGHFIRYRWEMFSSPSWLAIYAGFDMLPDTYDLSVDGYDAGQLSGALAEMRRAVAEVVASTATHGDFIERYARPQPVAAE